MGKETYTSAVPGLTPPQEEEKEEQTTDNASAVEPKKEDVQSTQQTESVQPTATTTPNATTAPNATDNTDAKQSSVGTQSEGKVVTPYTVTPPPEQPDYDAIEKGIEDKDKEQRKADAKRQRSRAIVSALGDGLTALSNLYFTTQYAPNMNTGRGELSAKNVERWDKYVKERDAKLAEYKKTAIERADKKYENDYTRWKDDLVAKQKQQEIGIKEQAEIRAQAKMEFDQAIEKAKDERDKAKHGIEMEILDLKAKGLYTDNKIKEYEEKIRQVESEFAEEKAKAELAYQNALTRKVNAETNLSRERGKTEKIKQIKIRSGSGSNAKDGPTITVRYDANGDATYQISGKNVTKAQVDALAKEYGLSSSDIDGDGSEDNSTYNWGGEKQSDNFYAVQKR